MKQFLLLFFLVSSVAPGFSQDRIYWGDQNLDKIGSITAGAFGSETSISGIQNPSGLAYYHSNPTYPLFYASSGEIYRHTLASANLVIDPVNQFNRGVTIDYIGKKIYWANSQEGYIGRANLDGTGMTETFITGLSSPWDIEIDPVNQKIYWTEAETGGSIGRANLVDGSNVEQVILNVYSQGIGVDPLRGKIFYTVFASGTNVYAADLDGSNAALIPGLSAIADIDVDLTTGMIYMVDYGSNPLTKSNPDGTNKTTHNASGTFLTYADVTTPVISSIVRQMPSIQNIGQTGTATFRVTFSEPVLGVSASDFEIDGTPTGTVSVTPVSLNRVYDVSISNISGTGSLGLNIAASQDIFDFRGNAYGGTVTSEQSFTAVTAAQPTIVSFTPATAPVGGIITITGTNFSTSPGDHTVTINGTTATVDASTATTLTVLVPAGATDGPITVTVNGVMATSDTDFVVCTPPTKPLVTRAGNVLSSSADEGNQWYFNSGEIQGATAKTYTALQPGNYSVKQTAAGCSTMSDPLSVTEEMLTPSISGFSPDSGTPGTSVVLTGSTFGATTVENVVKFNGTAALVSASSPTSITAVVPMGAGTGPITVTYNGRTGTSTGDFNYMCIDPPKPTITHDGGLLTSSSNTNNQWLRNDVEIAGATNKTYTATEPGAYKVRVTIDGCSSVSDATTTVGTVERLIQSITAYPNPGSDVVVLQLPMSDGTGKLDIFSTTGVHKGSIDLNPGQSSLELNVRNYADGMYIVVVTTSNGRTRAKLQKCSRPLK